MRAKTGRAPRYTAERVQRIVLAIRMGATFRVACLYGGIGETTFYHWKQTRPEFREAVENAEGVAAIGWLAKIEEAANVGTWQAAAWKLERRYPHEYGRTATEVTGRDGGAIVIDDLTRARALVEERLRRVAATIGASGDSRKPNA